ncbi:hypothetical protein Pcinc_009086 [Petrolisthes cinctipes]|uniref:Reverse transcriptase RNase H-like domain-containing protein n=1 Tax=Petrolisthes cinctipes TaxID=88211 RepID=A0AAE1G8R1_PETCI|nr:hypothetical protein Pcinc_010575 [Petrolisthes cinctipes]KAK3886766.1 hypothetical protein Pcinc_009086 [Petrolisthes cinctipes]
MEPFRELLKKPNGKGEYWDNTLASIFKSTKETIRRLAVEGLRYYDTSCPTIVLTDYSRQGKGFLVMQQYCQCVSWEAPMCCKDGWQLVLCGSRHLTEAEKNYSTLEGEALAITRCLKKARLFLLGYRNLTFVKDKANCAADTLSCYQALASTLEESDETDDETVSAATVAVVAGAAEDDKGHVVDLKHVEEEAPNASLRYDQSAHDFTPLEPGQRTLIQNPATGRWDLAGTIMEQTTPRVPDMARWQRWGYT